MQEIPKTRVLNLLVLRPVAFVGFLILVWGHVLMQIQFLWLGMTTRSTVVEGFNFRNIILGLVHFSPKTAIVLLLKVFFLIHCF